MRHKLGRYISGLLSRVEAGFRSQRPAFHRVEDILVSAVGVFIVGALAFVYLWTGWVLGACTWVIGLIREYLATALTLCWVLAFVIYGVSYWHDHPGLTWQQCAYGEPTCSSAAATWALASFAVLSFLAAARAVVWTRKTFEIEVQLQLGQSGCAQHEDSHINKEIFVTGDSQVLLDGKPVGFTKADLSSYHEHHVAFTNLGRSALADVRVHVCFADVRGVKSSNYQLLLGSIRCSDEIHVAIYISDVFSDMKVLWSGATEKNKPLDFFAVDSLTSAGTRYSLPDPRQPLPGMALANAPAPAPATPPAGPTNPAPVAPMPPPANPGGSAPSGP